mmetsp:Transcript_53728/g.64808  ORF Transcript_53728/g.64808 Transcript_53728/m.64808 type:complete len:258 (-) Transcript_53728:58-831(-)|eukprot:CAMPEP_0172488764 /NCGR_PEP_ID=MMETSP1066-20121228/18493_1 /TAXON_ID=671091 /ORGANISM="Coscinodiscus wailesii, Strain CCMP2513" /LENGTH=257 /DNA_ID=CAMNT_0013256219 /DNA_START=98 /DNA_END=871 /DNA_ORIENTATION=+
MKTSSIVNSLFLLAIVSNAGEAFQNYHRYRASSLSAPVLKAVVTKTDDEWRDILSEDAYRVLREDGTEPAFTSSLNDVKENGTFTCAGCGNPLYQTATKYESGSGWPSFFSPIDGDAIELSVDYKLVLPRTEVRCGRCDGHLGHVFDDGPKPTGKRYCMNGVAMNFVADGADLELAKEVIDRTKNREGGPVKVKEPVAAAVTSIAIDGAISALFLKAFISNASDGIGGVFEFFPLLIGAFYAGNSLRRLAGLLPNSD